MALQLPNIRMLMSWNWGLRLYAPINIIIGFTVIFAGFRNVFIQNDLSISKIIWRAK